MSKIKGKYVATIIIEFNSERMPGMLPIEEIQKKLSDGSFTEHLKQEISDSSDLGKVQIIQQQADIYEE